MADIIIIGAGIGGLATANLLAQDGHSVTIFEKNDQLGGRAGQFRKDGFTFDTGPSWYLMPKVFDRYFSLLGSSAAQELDLVRLSPAYKVYSGDAPAITISGDLEKDSQTFETYETGAGEQLKTYVSKSKRTYRLSLDHFLYSNFDKKHQLLSSAVLTNAKEFAQLASTSIHNYVATFVKHPRLQQILEYPMVFLGSSPYTAPAIFSLMSALDFDEGVYYPKGTMYAVVEALVRYGNRLGVTYHTNTAVKEIITESGKTCGVRLKDGTVRAADIVISNADLHFTETELLTKKARSYPSRYWAKKEASPSALLMYLGIEGEVPEFEHHTLLFTEKWKDNFTAIFKDKAIPKPASLYISKTSQTDTTAPAGCENIFVLVPLPAGVSLSGHEQSQLADDYLRQIKQSTGVDLKARTITRTLFGPNDFSEKYNAWQSTMLGPSHKLTQSAFFRTPNKSKKIKNLFYVGASTVPGIGVPMCLISAELVRQRIATYIQKEKKGPSQ